VQLGPRGGTSFGRGTVSRRARRGSGPGTLSRVGRQHGIAWPRAAPAARPLAALIVGRVGRHDRPDLVQKRLVHLALVLPRRLTASACATTVVAVLVAVLLAEVFG
jgi:hypothetical protein